MSKARTGMIEILDNFYAKASPDAAELITRHAAKRNKEVQSKNGTATKTRAKKAEKPADKVEGVQ